MMKHLHLLVLILLASLLPTRGQEIPLPREDRSAAQIPDWLADFSNLPGDIRTRYLDSFRNAKIAYAQGQWVTCIACLADCEMIYRGNPNIWALRASCLMEQGYYDEAAEEIQAVLKVQPEDPVTIMNLANLQLARGEYRESIRTIHNLRSILPYNTQKDILYVLDFRELLCHVMLGQHEDAHKLVKGLTPLSDTPLYYYSQAVFAMAEGNRMEASRCIRIASHIFSNGGNTVPFQRALELSEIANKLTPGAENK